MSPRFSRYPEKVAAIFHKPSAGWAAATSVGDLARGKLMISGCCAKYVNPAMATRRGEEYNLYREKARENGGNFRREILKIPLINIISIKLDDDEWNLIAADKIPSLKIDGKIFL